MVDESTAGTGAPERADQLERAAQATVAERCPVLSSYNPMASEEVSDREASWILALKSGVPVQYVEPVGMWMLFSHELISEMLRDTETFSNVDAFVLPPVPEELRERLPYGWPHFGTAASLIGTDPPEHTPVRKLADKALSPRAVAALEPRVREIASEMLDGFYACGGADMLEESLQAVPDPCPRRSHRDPRSVFRARFPEWGEASINIVNPALTPDEVLHWGIPLADLNEHLVELIERRRHQPEDDLLTRLVEGHQDDAPMLTTPQIVSIVTQLITAGSDSTATLISNTLYLTQTRYPAEWQRMTSDPATIPLVVEEMLRIKSPFTGFMRRTTREAQLGDVRIPAGAHIMCMSAAAGVDPHQWEDPQSFDHERPDLGRHLTFGRGAHFCIGAPLARLQTRVALEEIVRRMPDLHLKPGADPKWAPLLAAQSLESLPMEWSVLPAFATAAEA